MDANADLKTTVQLTPEKSQIFVLSLVGLTGISLVASFVFLWNKPELCWVPFTFAGIFSAMAYASWHTSHKNIDMHGATATSISSQPNGGLSVITDSRVLDSIGGQNALAQLVSIVAYRQQLPLPSGMVDDSGLPIENSGAEAIKQVQAINHEVAHATEQVFGSVKKADVGDLTEQLRLSLPMSVAEKLNKSNFLSAN